MFDNAADTACTTTELVDGLEAAHRRMGGAQREFLVHLAAADDARVWRDDDCRSMGHWVAINYGISSFKATRMVAAGHALSDLPLLDAALTDGILSLDKILELCRFATFETEKKLIAWARRVSLGAIKDRADFECRKPLEEVSEQERARRLDYWHQPDGMLSIYGLLPADKGAKVITALDRLAGKLASSPEDDDDPETNASQRRADALVALASAHIANDPVPDRASVVVHVPVRTLSHGDANGTLATGHVIAPEVARSLCCYSRMEFVLENDNGRIVGHGRSRRTLTPRLSRALRQRDGHRCTFSGCGNRAFLAEHHIDWWGPGQGRTDLDKTILVCPAHHDLIHKYGWRVHLKDGVEAQWFRPNGDLFVPGPAPPLEPALAR